MGLRFSPTTNILYYLNLLLKAAEEYDHAFDVYTHETMPERYHFSYNDRIAPIYVVPKVGYLLTDHEENGVGMSKGVSHITYICFHFCLALFLLLTMQLITLPESWI
jgi:hypothetical protein